MNFADAIELGRQRINKRRRDRGHGTGAADNETTLIRCTPMQARDALDIGAGIGEVHVVDTHAGAGFGNGVIARLKRPHGVDYREHPTQRPPQTRRVVNIHGNGGDLFSGNLSGFMRTATADNTFREWNRGDGLADAPAKGTISSQDKNFLYHGCGASYQMACSRVPSSVNMPAEPHANTDIMNESEFDIMATNTLLSIEQAIEVSGAEIEFEGAGGILTLEFENGSKIIVNKQSAAKQIWVAGQSRRLSLRFVTGKWINNQGGGELLHELSLFIREQSGEEIDLG